MSPEQRLKWVISSNLKFVNKVILWILLNADDNMRITDFKLVETAELLGRPKQHLYYTLKELDKKGVIEYKTGEIGLLIFGELPKAPVTEVRHEPDFTIKSHTDNSIEVVVGGQCTIIPRMYKDRDLLNLGGDEFYLMAKQCIMERKMGSEVKEDNVGKIGG